MRRRGRVARPPAGQHGARGDTKARRIKKLGCTPLCNAPPDCIEPLRRPPPALRTGMYILTGKVWEILTGKLRLQIRLLRGEISLRPGLPCEPVTPRAATAFRQDTASSKNTAFTLDYYAVKSHYIPTIASQLALPKPSRRAPRRLSGKIRLRARLLRGGISSRGGAAARGGVREYVRGDVARRGSFARRARSDALRRVPSSLMREISVRNKISSMARSAISACVIAPAIRSCGPQRRNEPSDTADRKETYIRHRRKGSGNRKGDSAY